VAGGAERAANAVTQGHAGSAPRRRRNGVSVRRSSQHLDRSGIRVNTSEYGKSSQHLDRSGIRVNTSEHGKSSQHLDRSGARVSTSGIGSRVSTSTRMVRIPSQHLGVSGEWYCFRVNSSSAWERCAARLFCVLRHVPYP